MTEHTANATAPAAPTADTFWRGHLGTYYVVSAVGGHATVVDFTESRLTVVPTTALLVPTEVAVSDIDAVCVRLRVPEALAADGPAAYAGLEAQRLRILQRTAAVGLLLEHRALERIRAPATAALDLRRFVYSEIAIKLVDDLTSPDARADRIGTVAVAVTLPENTDALTEATLRGLPKQVAASLPPQQTSLYFEPTPTLAPAIPVAPRALRLPLRCPACAWPHHDKDEWATKLHRKHLCERCQHLWTPAEIPTVGVPWTFQHYQCRAGLWVGSGMSRANCTYDVVTCPLGTTIRTRTAANQLERTWTLKLRDAVSHADTPTRVFEYHQTQLPAVTFTASDCPDGSELYVAMPTWQPGDLWAP